MSQLSAVISLELISTKAASLLKKKKTQSQNTREVWQTNLVVFPKPGSRFPLQLRRACRTSTSNRIPALRLFIFNSVCALGAISYSAHPLNCEGWTKAQAAQCLRKGLTIKIHFGDSLLIAVEVLWGYAPQRATERNVNAIVRCLNFKPLSTPRSLDGGFADIFPFM